jgi:hypothetical protein
MLEEAINETVDENQINIENTEVKHHNRHPA